jgi:hypothetical protein
VFLKKHCMDCHDSASKEGGLDLSTIDFDLRNSEAFSVWIKVHDRVRDGEMPPKDAIRPPEGETKKFLATLDAKLINTNSQIQTTEGRARARRLSRDEYQATLTELLSVHRDYRDLLPEDGRALGFDKVASALNVSAEHLESYVAAAELALEDAFAPAEHVSKQKFPQRWELMSRIQRGFNFQFAKAPDALIYFSDHWDNITGFTANQAGRYRFTVRGRAHQSSNPVKARIRAGMDSEASRRIVTYTEFPPEAAEFTVETWLNPRETLHVCPIGVAPPSRNPTIHRVHLKRDNPGSRYGGPGLALEWVEVEGPLPDERFRQSILANVDLVSGSRADADKVLKRFLPLAFRRPVAASEVDHYLQVFDRAATSGDFASALKGTLQAVLCSPHFLYLHGPPGPLDQHSLAARLSYFLWNGPPDAALTDLAKAATIHDPIVLKDQVERMLDDPKALQFKEKFTAQWLDLRLINATTPDPELYPEFDELLEWSSVQETRRFFNELLQNNFSVRNFVKSDFVMLNDRLAEHYGISGVDGIAIRRVQIEPGSARSGLLGQASILKVTANGTTTSPILRGVWVMDRLVGEPPPPPPAGIPALEPDIRGASTIREQLAKHREDSSCAACHAKIDPAGFALECFDVIGGFRERYRASREGAKETVSVERPIYIDVRAASRNASISHPRVAVGLGPEVDPSSEFAGRSFDGVQEFCNVLLAEPDQIARAFVTKLAIYATGSDLQYADRAVVDEIVNRLRESDYGVRSAIHEVVQSSLFLNR